MPRARKPPTPAEQEAGASVRQNADGRRRNTRRAQGASATVFEPGDGSRPLKSVSHERFARLVAIRETPMVDAWRAVFDPKEEKTRAYALKAANRVGTCRPDVVARIQYLTDMSIRHEIERVEVTREYVTLQMVEIYEMARNDGSYPAAVKAMELLGVDLGMFVRKTQHEHRRKPIDAQDVTAVRDQLSLLVSEALGPRIGRAFRSLLDEHLVVDVTPVADPESEPARLPPGDEPLQ